MKIEIKSDYAILDHHKVLREGERSLEIYELQRVIGAPKDGIFGKLTASVLRKEFNRTEICLDEIKGARDKIPTAEISQLLKYLLNKQSDD